MAIKELKPSQPEKPADDTRRSGTPHPYFDFAASLKVAEAVQQQGGGSCTPDQLAHWLDYASTRSGTYLTRVAAATKHFGLIELSGDRLSLTERARKIVSPVMPEDATKAKADAFMNVALFSKVYDRYHGSTLPPESGLRNLFRDEFKLLPDRVDQAVRVFLNSAEQTGILHEGTAGKRLIKPSGGSSSNAHPASPASAEATSPPPERKSSAGGGGDGPAGVHSAIIGLLRELPPPGTTWDARKKDRFLSAFKATIDFIYPEQEPVE